MEKIETMIAINTTFPRLILCYVITSLLFRTPVNRDEESCRDDITEHGKLLPKAFCLQIVSTSTSMMKKNGNGYRNTDEQGLN
jgi:hypothetical protein